MQKIRLVLDALTVESFSTGQLSTEKGTVQADASGGYTCTANESYDPYCYWLPGPEQSNVQDVC